MKGIANCEKVCGGDVVGCKLQVSVQEIKGVVNCEQCGRYEVSNSEEMKTRQQRGNKEVQKREECAMIDNISKRR